jgi:hypothetical protein
MLYESDVKLRQWLGFLGLRALVRGGSTLSAVRNAECSGSKISQLVDTP